jgi:type IV secretory pathway TrbF-like protein
MFKRSTVRYGKTPGPETPYQKAGQVWDERIGSARVQATNWRLAFFGALALSGGLAGGLVWQSARGTITPWVVQVDRLGQAQAIAPAVADYQPTDPQIAWHLARFIDEVRSIPADPVVLRQDWLDAYNYVTDKGALALNDYAQDQLIALRQQNAAADAATPVATGVDINALNFRYRIEGDNPAWRPLRAFDDGRQVFIEFPSGISQGELPPLWVIGAEGDGQLVNYRVKGNHMIVDRLFAAAELKLGGKHQQLVRIVRTDGRPQS